MTTRFQVSFAAVGSDLRANREEFTRAVVSMGHIPIDLTATGIFDRDPWDTLERHLRRSDYLVLMVDASADGPVTPFDKAKRAAEAAASLDVPVLLFAVEQGKTVEQGKAGEALWTDLSRPLVRCVQDQKQGMQVTLDSSADSITSSLVRLIDTFDRPGWVSATDVPTANIADELAKLVERAKNGSPAATQGDGDARRGQRRDTLIRALRGNRIHVPLWAVGASEWEDPIELSLFDFFLRIAPEMAVEKSVADLAEFIPGGVCEKRDDGLNHRWLVPPHSLKLWLTDLMALGVMEPSNRKHSPKDNNEYWRLTPTGRDLVSEVRRPVLESGGHRHVGFTEEFPIVDNAIHLTANS